MDEERTFFSVIAYRQKKFTLIRDSGYVPWVAEKMGNWNCCHLALAMNNRL